MKMQCAGRCIKAYNRVLETTLINTIKDFLSGLEAIYDNQEVFQQFYDYLQMKYAIPCEIGMLFIEKLTTNTLFKVYLSKVDSMNRLTNDKIKLYQWIKPKHLEIQNFDFTEIIACFLQIKNSSVPSVKIFYLMNGIKKLYEKIGKESGLDVFFPYLVYNLIKANLLDLYAHLHYMNIFKRKFFKTCDVHCTHGFKFCVTCDCLISKNWDSEEEYYLTTSIAAVDYISKLEFYNLKIEADEFETEILKRLESINLTDKV